MDLRAFKALSGTHPLDLSGLDESTTTVELGHYHAGLSEVEWGHIRRLKSLKRLFLLWSGVNDADLSHLLDLSALTELDLTGTNVSDRGLEIISKLTSLKVLCLARCHNVTGEGLVHLSSLTNLTCLFLPVRTAPSPKIRGQRTGSHSTATFSTAEVEALQVALPLCTIWW